MTPPHRCLTIDSPIDAACVASVRRQIALLQWRSDEPVALILNSRKVCVESACDLFEVIERARAKTRIIGYTNDTCQSAAVLVLVACDERHCPPTASLIFEHRNASCLPQKADGTDASVSLDARRRQHLWRRYVGLYAKRLEASPETVEFLFASASKLKRLSARRAHEEGFITNILPIDQLMAA